MDFKIENKLVFNGISLLISWLSFINQTEKIRLLLNFLSMAFLIIFQEPNQQPSTTKF